MDASQQASSPQHQVFENIPLHNVESHWETLFHQFDRNGDGRISVQFLNNELKKHNQGVPDYVVKRIVLLADRDRDSYITLQEFLQLVESPHAQPLLKVSLQRYIQTFVPRQRRVQEAVDGSYEQEYTCDPPALTMVICSIIEIFFYMYDTIVAANPLATNAPFFNLFVYNPHRRAEVWRFLTYMFIHGSESHLIVNLIVQILLGIPLEMVHRWWRVFLIYIAGVISGSLFTSVADPRVYLAGASGGCYALLAAHIATIIMNWTEMDHPVLQLLIFVTLITFDFGNSIYDRYIEKRETKTAYAAHIAGAAAGFLVGVYLLRNLKVHDWEKTLWWISVFIFNAFIIIVIFWNIFFPSYFPPASVSLF
ncbi:rhomboid-related protein 3 isoform X1 [Planococcus citri]|uniref:rhomboid-related protein 3 isoform X1 n=1 Tax=Planococcus citri TaxID=170843 RepID=UPI0031F9E089